MAKRVDSSWIDMLAGLLLAGMRRMPPDFCARALGPASAPASRATHAATLRIVILPVPIFGPAAGRDPIYRPIECLKKWVPACAGTMLFDLVYLSSQTSSMRQPL